MARYILIDRHSGYIFADTADLKGWSGSDMDPTDAARLLHIDIKDGPMVFEETDQHDVFASYDVYRADIEGSESVPVVSDGQDREMIEAVERDCRYTTSLKRVATDD